MYSGLSGRWKLTLSFYSECQNRPRRQTLPVSIAPDLPDTDEAALIAAARRGDLNAFSSLVRIYERNIRACIRVRVNNPDDAAELAQETFIAAFRQLDRFSTGRPLGPWLRGIAFNLIRNHRRKFRADPVGGSQELEALAAAELDRLHAEGCEENRAEALEQCLQELTADDASLISSRYASGAGVTELCLRWKKKHSALTMQLHRIRLQLRHCIERRMAGATLP